MLINVLALIVLLVIAFVVGYCGAKPHGFHKLGQFFGIVDTKENNEKAC